MKRKFRARDAKNIYSHSVQIAGHENSRMKLKWELDIHREKKMCQKILVFMTIFAH
jgi:hypothetical protein